MAGEQGEGEHRQELGEAQHADRERRLGDRRSLARDRIDLPRERDRLDLHGERGAEPADPEPDIGSDAKKVAERGRVLQDRFGGDDACGIGVGRGTGHERVSLGRRGRPRQGRAALKLVMDEGADRTKGVSYARKFTCIERQARPPGPSNAALYGGMYDGFVRSQFTRSWLRLTPRLDLVIRNYVLLCWQKQEFQC